MKTLRQDYKDQLTKDFYSEVTAQEFSSPKLIAYNKELASFLNLPDMSNDEACMVFSGQKNISSSTPIALVYSGHQFGHFVPRLGDGRAKLLGNIEAQDQKTYDIQLKGSGRTEYSRRGDGLSALGPVIREYIVSEAMHHLGVPTTRALAAVTTGEQVFRENMEPGGVFTRVARSHVRIGTFEYFFSQGDEKSLKLLADYCIQNLYPESENYLEFFKTVCEKQIKLVSQWLSLGFIHGVMNTDNMSIAGETIDYGPCAFMDEFDFYKKFSFIDRDGRYAYINQAPILQWNLSNFAQCLLPLIPEEQHESINEELETITPRVESEWLDLMSEKLGFQNTNIEIVKQFLQLLQENQLDFTLSFRRLSDFTKSLHNESELSFIKEPKAKQAYIEFIEKWQIEHSEKKSNIENLNQKLNDKNPIYIPRNHLVQMAIEKTYEGNYELFHKLNEVLKNPFKIQSGNDFHLPPTSENRVTTTFCGT